MKNFRDRLFYSSLILAGLIAPALAASDRSRVFIPIGLMVVAVFVVVRLIVRLFR